jgi:hypothetical protein
MNSSTPSTTAPSRHSSVRFAREIARLVWNRRMGWTLVCVISLLTLYYQWENWRSALELKTAHQRLVERLGTDNMLKFAPPSIPDEQNYFALPVVEKWATGELSKGSRFKRYFIPKGTFLPAAFQMPELIENDDDGTSHIDFTSWAAKRPPSTESAAIVMDCELGDANGLLPQLAVGLNRPFSCLKPCMREALEVAGTDSFDVEIPNVGNLNDPMRALCLHLRCAAAAGNAAKVRQMALILLRLFPEAAATHGVLVSSLVSVALHGLAFQALQDALSEPAWDEASLLALQLQLAKINDLKVIEHAICTTTLWVFAEGIGNRRMYEKNDVVLLNSNWGNDANDWKFRLLNQTIVRAYTHGPTGWLDANIAFNADTLMDAIGPTGDLSWLQSAERYSLVKQRLEREYAWKWNPRRFIGAIALPNIGNLFIAAAETLFHRRCLIIACALEKHRLKHGSYPISLEIVKNDLQLFHVTDPARANLLPGYRLEPDGYLLWSAGSDAQDDGGVKDKDWLWRMKREP